MPPVAEAERGTADHSGIASGTVLDRARRVRTLLIEAAPRIEAEREVPADVMAKLHDAGLFRLLLPRSVGGDELDLKTHAQVMETVASFDASTAWCMGQGAGCAMSAAFMEPEAAKRLFGPRDAVLQSLRGPRLAVAASNDKPQQQQAGGQRQALAQSAPAQPAPQGAIPLQPKSTG